MFSAIFNRAQATVDNAIGQVVNRAIIAVPFIIASGFATATVFIRLNREFGSETATLYMAGAFAVIGLVTTAVFSPRATAVTEAAQPAAAVENSGSAAEAVTPPLSQTDKELLYAALSSAAPIALPGLVRLVVRNWAIIAAILAAVFVLTREAEAPAPAERPAPN